MSKRLDRHISDINNKFGDVLRRQTRDTELLRKQIEELQRKLDGLKKQEPNTGVALIMVRNGGKFKITGPGTNKAGTWAGAYRLPPRTYTVYSQGETSRIQVKAGDISVLLIGPALRTEG